MADEGAISKKEINKRLEAMDKKALIQIVKGNVKKEDALRKEMVVLKKTIQKANEAARYAADKLANSESATKYAQARLVKFKTAIEAVMATKYPGRLYHVRGLVTLETTTEKEVSAKEWEEINLLNHLHELASI